MADPREEALYAAGWRRIEGRWVPPAGEGFTICRRARPGSWGGFSFDDAVALNALIEATKRHRQERGR